MAAGNQLPLSRPNEAPLALHPSSRSLPRLAALVLGRLDRARIQDAMRDRAIVDQVDSVAALERVVARSIPRVAAIITEPFDIARTPTAPVIARLRAEYPGVALIAYCQPGHKHSTEIIQLARAGANELVFRGIDDSASAFRQTLARAAQASAGEEVLNALRPIVPERAMWIIEAAVQYAWPDFSARELALALGLNVKTLVRHCRGAGLPSPGALLNWVRLMVVAYLLQAEGRRLEHVAGAFGFESASPLRNLMKRYTGLRALEVRERGGLGVVIESFQRADAFGRLELPDESRDG